MDDEICSWVQHQTRQILKLNFILFTAKNVCPYKVKATIDQLYAAILLPKAQLAEDVRVDLAKQSVIYHVLPSKDQIQEAKTLQEEQKKQKLTTVKCNVASID